MAVRWLALGWSSSFGQGDVRQKAAFCCSSGAAAVVSEKNWRGQLEDKAHNVCGWILPLQEFHCAFFFFCSTQRFILFKSCLFFFKITYHTRRIKAKMNTVFIGWLNLKVPQHLCRHNKPVPAFLVILCVVVSYLQMGKTISRTSLWFFGIMKPIHGIGRTRLHLSPFKAKPFQALTACPKMFKFISSPSPGIQHEILKLWVLREK